MKHGTLRGVLTATLLAGFTTAVLADVKENPYQVIIDRNPFGLKPIPPPPVVTQAEPTNAPPPVEIKLTGITTLLDTPKVLLEFHNTQTKKKDMPRPLAVGDVESGIEILAIDAEAGTVKVKNGGAETLLDFEKNGIKPAAVAVAVPAGVPGAPPVRPPIPPPKFTAAVPGAPGASTTASRAIVAGNTLQPTANVPAPAANPLANTIFANNAGAIPARPLRVDTGSGVIVAGGGQPVQSTQPAATAQPALTPDQAAVMIEAQRQHFEQKSPGMSRILPPTRFTPPAPGQNQGRYPAPPTPQ